MNIVQIDSLGVFEAEIRGPSRLQAVVKIEKPIFRPQGPMVPERNSCAPVRCPTDEDVIISMLTEDEAPRPFVTCFARSDLPSSPDAEKIDPP